MQRPWCLIFVIFCIQFAFGADIPADPVQAVSRHVLEAGLRQFWNGDYDAADLSFDKYILMNPDDPVGYWRKALTLYVRSRREKKSESPKLSKRDYEQAIAMIDDAIKKADSKVRNLEDRDLNLYVEASLYSLRAAFEFGQGSWFGSKSTLLAGLELARNSHYPDAKHLEALANYRGADHYILFRMPGMRAVPHDREESYAQFAEAMKDNDGLFSDDIRIVLLKIQLDRGKAKRKPANPAEAMFDTLFPAEDLCKALCAKYPENENVKKYLESIR